MSNFFDSRRIIRVWFYTLMVGAVFFTWTSTWDWSYCATEEIGWPFPYVMKGCPCNDIKEVHIPCVWGITLMYWAIISFIIALIVSAKMDITIKFFGIVFICPAFAVGLYYLFVFLFTLFGWYVPWAVGEAG